MKHVLYAMLSVSAIVLETRTAKVRERWHMPEVALVTGAAGGIGRAICEALAASDLLVVASDTREDPAIPAARFVQSDLRTLAGCERLAAEAGKAGRIRVLVNNAGMQHVSPLSEFPDASWEDMIAVMLSAPFRLSKLLWPDLTARPGGRIVNIASIHAVVASAEKAAYVAAKHGLLGLTKVLALEGGQFGLTANAICPSYVRTRLVEEQLEQRSLETGLSVEQIVDDVMLAPLAVRRFVEPNEIARLVSYLCEPLASSISGAPLMIDGGWTAR